MKNLISFIAEARHLGKENLATDILAEILRSPIARKPFVRYLSLLGCDLPAEYEISTQERGVSNRCIPDLYVRDIQNRALAIVESKFWAGFTPHQPESYLREIGRGGLLLFVVPEKRRESVFHELTNRCLVDTGQYQKRRWQARIDGRHLVVSTWNELLEALHPDETQQHGDHQLLRYKRYLDELEAFCEVAAREVFPPLTDEQIRGFGIASIITHIKWLTENIIMRCLRDGTLNPQESASRKDNLGADHDTSIYFGRNLRIGSFPVWIGFWGSVWEERESTPIWIAIEKGKQNDLWLSRVRSRKGNDSVIRHTSGNDEYFLIPIPIVPHVDQEAVVASACQFIGELEEISRATEPTTY